MDKLLHCSVFEFTYLLNKDNNNFLLELLYCLETIFSKGLVQRLVYIKLLLNE